MDRARVALIATFACTLWACSAGDQLQPDDDSGGGDTSSGGGEVVDSVVFDTAQPDTAPETVAPDGGPSPEVAPDGGEGPEVVPEPGAFGAACTENNECLTGWCVTSNLGPVCTRTCVDECPSGWSCVGITGETDITFLCVPKGDRLCEPCSVDTQCGSGFCLEMEEGKRCTASCADGAECPAGYSCEMSRSETTIDREGLQCVPTHGSCECLPGREGLQRPCNNQSAAGTCWGLETCRGADGWSTCDAPVPSAEVCDGVDNNCNRVVDEGLIDDTPCEKENEFGTCVGQRVCQGELGMVCLAPEAAPETCNFADDDCDGLVDEDFADPVSGIYAGDENCGVCGNDCTDFFPNAVSGCAIEGGAARCVVRSCLPGYYQAGPSTCLPIVRSACLPCTEDANCVVPGNACVPLDGGNACAEDCAVGNLNGRPAGQCDPGFTCKPIAGTERRACMPNTNSCECLLASDAGETRACTQSNAFGTCAGSQTCNPASGGFSACTARVPAAEICNGQDDDCDGLVDEDVVAPAQACAKTNSHGTCEGDWSCAGASGWVCNALTPAAETCNARDDDCDGTTDEGFKDAASGLYTSDDHCGLCGRNCDSVVLFAAATECRVEAGIAVCVATRCDNGFYIPPDTNRVCVPSSGATPCSPCADDAQCSELADGRCTTIDGGRFCTRGCATSAECGGGYTCEDGRCLPSSRSCTCLAADFGAVRPCVRANGFGTCTGLSTCNPNASPGWSECSAEEPAPEDCNGLDDNCDGRIDEGVVHDPPTCEQVNAFGACTSTWRCDPAAGWVCPVDTPELEVCNFQDDDCDGQTDEGFQNAQGRYVSDENCGNCGSSCVGLIPNATAHCVDSGARPRCEVATCQTGYYKAGPLTCLPAVDTACVPCASDANCPTPGDRCLSFDDGKFCGRDCSAGNAHGIAAGECAAGFSCETFPALGGAEQCVPSSGSCSCLEGDRGALRTCQVQNDAGTCFGTQSCVPETGWSLCGAATPEPEICNGQDDDCDGQVDEGVSEPEEPCANTVGDDTCSAPWLCNGAQGWVCNAAVPSAEVCNGRDDDCDGTTDDLFRNVDGVYAVFEHCGACGISCDGAIPNAAEQCVVQGTTARCEVASCDLGYYQAGATTCLPATDARCVPCVSDANCPTPGDLCLELDGARYCGRDCAAGNKHGLPAGECGEGYECAEIAGTGGAVQCVPLSGSCTCLDQHRDEVRSCSVSSDHGTCGGTEVCVPEVGWGGCTAKTAKAEVCNGEDDDCDGRIDEDVEEPSEACAVTVGDDTCTGAWVCAADHWVCTAATPVAETCNGRDDDCDGVVDDPFRDGAGIYADDAHCGACGIACAGMIPNAIAACVVTGQTARCEVATCQSGFYQASPLTCLPATDATCLPCVSDAHCPTPGDRCLELDGGKFCGRDCAADNKHGLPAGACDEGFTCVAIDGPGGAMQCVPASGSCTCLSGNDDNIRTCVDENDAGRCFGFETCASESGWQDCTAREPAAETCNGIDDDCDGLVDEDVEAPSEPCAVENEFGTCEAAWICSGASGWKCNAATPGEEVCDFVDNDCDGAVDEDYKSGALYTDDLNCGSCGIACAGAIPNATAVCDLGPTGAPRCEVGTCDDGYYRSSDLSCTAVSDNLCAPCNVDSDCRTPGDRCLSVGGEKLCGRDCSEDNLHGNAAGECPSGYQCGSFGDDMQCVPVSGTCSCLPVNDGATRTCQRAGAAGVCFGIETCDAAEGWSECSAREPSAETCDGEDDDCDGLVDEGVSHQPETCEVENEHGTCGATWTCQAMGAGVSEWVCNPKTPVAELCNFQDDDCDSQVDEDFRDAEGRYVHDEHCGSCGVSCVGAIPNATASCAVSGASPRCEVASCAPGYYQAGPLTCLLASDNMCAPCVGDANCRTPGDRCLTLDGAQVCGRSCAADSAHGTECPAETYCRDFGGGVLQCVPVSDSCTCIAGDLGETRGCSTQNSIGSCFGQQVCDPATGWSACDAPEAEAETCNASDDDCNFVVDDVSGRGGACEITVQGVGTCMGVLDCVSGQGGALTCVGRTPSEESCNYLDDDCNGETDEAYPTLYQSCSVAEGACQRFGFQVCTAGGEGTQCNAVAGDPSPELCDGIDNDCDTEVDEGFDLKGTTCETGVGTCKRFGVYVCNDVGDATVCNAVAAAATSELCDLLDNDCDGQTDEDFKSADGTKYDRDTTCGNCFTDCTAIFAGRHQAYGVCDAASASPVCAMECNSGHFNLNAVPGDGCEFGLDAGAIYVGAVSQGASDVGDCGLGPVGTGVGNYPCKSIDRGLDRAEALGRGKVIVADGLYSEQVVMRDGVSLLGGHRADTWERHLASSNTTIRGPTVTSGHSKTVIAEAIESQTVLEGFIIYGGWSFGVSGNSYTIWVRDSGAGLIVRHNLLFGGIAGRGSDGNHGGNGDDGADGQQGERAIPTQSNTGCTLVGNVPLCYDSGTTQSGETCGERGTNACGGDVHGGDGAGATCPVNNVQQPRGYDGIAVAGGGAAGAGGAGGYSKYVRSDQTGCTITVGGNPTGLNGGDGGDGTSSTGGTGCAEVYGEVAGYEWTTGAGGDAQAGTAGGGGGGGGAGGGLDNQKADCSAGGDRDTLGGSGGGGGAGGCGGIGGSGGGSGGATIVVFITNTTVRSDTPSISDNVITRGTGGEGGNGGNGGKGGLGGEGGAGGVVYGGYQDFIGPGGRGGQGGDGGHGGGGGGGCGGASLGFFVHNVSGAPGYAAPGVNSLVDSGIGGSGGAGGISAGNAGSDGSDGVVDDANF